MPATKVRANRNGEEDAVTTQAKETAAPAMPPMMATTDPHFLALARFRAELVGWLEGRLARPDDAIRTVESIMRKGEMSAESTTGRDIEINVGLAVAGDDPATVTLRLDLAGW